MQINNFFSITVSTKYSDILEIILPQNFKFFDRWFIITDKNDFETINVIKNFNFSNVEILYFNFYNNSIFNKGGAIRLAQEIIYNNYKEKNILLLDSDIYLPDDFSQKMDEITIEHDTLYSTSHRKDYYSLNNFQNNVYDKIYENNFYGFFQLYKQNLLKLYNNSIDASSCDMEFSNKFFNKKIIDLEIKHLGKEAQNWRGRNIKNDFIF